jgi:SAM-dependent methyltransferase
MTDHRKHWDRVYSTKTETEVSWYQPRPERSLALIRSAAKDTTTPVIDVGCGTSTLIEELWSAGYRDLTGLDSSATATERQRQRLEAIGAKVEWIVADVVEWQPQRTWGIWHDGAVFHFLVERAAQDAYIRALSEALTPGGTAIIATFALDGPDRCSGLPVQRYSPETLSRRLGEGFQIVSSVAELHATPRGTMQSFSYAAFQRR